MSGLRKPEFKFVQSHAQSQCCKIFQTIRDDKQLCDNRSFLQLDLCVDDGLLMIFLFSC